MALASEIEPSHRVTDAWMDGVSLPQRFINASGVKREIGNRFTQQFEARAGTQSRDQSQSPPINAFLLELLQQCKGGFSGTDLINKKDHAGVGLHLFRTTVEADRGIRQNGAPSLPQLDSGR